MITSADQTAGTLKERAVAIVDRDGSSDMAAGAKSRRNNFAGWFARFSAWGALSAAVAVWAWVANTTDENSIGTMLAFGPRWLLLLPLVVLTLPAVMGRRGAAILPLSLTAVVILGPVMGFCVPWEKARGFSPPAGGFRIKILTCNTLEGHADGRLDLLIEQEHPDVVVLQEWPREKSVESQIPGAEEPRTKSDAETVHDSKLNVPSANTDGSESGILPKAEEKSGEWRVARAGGIVIASRLPIVASEPLQSPSSKWRTIGLRCELATIVGRVQLFGLHLLSPRKGLEAVLENGFGGLKSLNEITAQRQLDGIAVESWMDAHPGPKLVAGDFNLTPESTIYRRRFGHLQNAFSNAGWGYGGTKFTRIHGVRIDHVLADESWSVVNCRVGADVGSDHRPVVAELARQTQ